MYFISVYLCTEHLFIYVLNICLFMYWTSVYLCTENMFIYVLNICKRERLSLSKWNDLTISNIERDILFLILGPIFKFLSGSKVNTSENWMSSLFQRQRSVSWRIYRKISRECGRERCWINRVLNPGRG